MSPETRLSGIIKIMLFRGSTFSFSVFKCCLKKHYILYGTCFFVNIKIIITSMFTLCQKLILCYVNYINRWRNSLLVDIPIVCENLDKLNLEKGPLIRASLQCMRPQNLKVVPDPVDIAVRGNRKQQVGELERQHMDVCSAMYTSIGNLI